MRERGHGKAPEPQPSPRPVALAGSGVTLRPATPADGEFCHQVHKAAMGEYVTAIWGWDGQVQRAFHDRAFNPRRCQIIMAGQAAQDPG